MGGVGWESVKGVRHLISIGNNRIKLSNLDVLISRDIRIDDLLDIEISGSGTIQAGGGFIGGGFGASAVGGMAIATVLNVLTRHSKTKTLLRLCTASSECVLLSENMDLEEARIYFSEAFVAVKKKNNSESGSISEEIVRLKRLHVEGVLSDGEFEKAKAAVINRLNF